MKNTGLVRGVLVIACSLSLAGTFVAYRAGWLRAAPVETHAEVNASNAPPKWSEPKPEHLFSGSKSSLAADGPLDFNGSFERPETQPAPPESGRANR